jgi:flavodoxin
MSGKNLILYYTWVGNTKVVAEEIQRQTGFEMLQISERKERPKNKVMGAAMGSFLGFHSRLSPMDYFFSGYDGLYLGAQVWAGKTTPAINTFLRKAQLKDKRVWLFITKADDKVPQKVIDSISARILKRGGTLVDTLSITAPWDPRNPTVLSPETIKDQVQNWLKPHV